MRIKLLHLKIGGKTNLKFFDQNFHSNPQSLFLNSCVYIKSYLKGIFRDTKKIFLISLFLCSSKHSSC